LSETSRIRFISRSLVVAGNREGIALPDEEGPVAGFTQAIVFIPKNDPVDAGHPVEIGKGLPVEDISKRPVHQLQVEGQIEGLVRCNRESGKGRNNR